MPAGCYIDANLLTLLVVGTTDEDLIRKHRRLRNFTADDYATLVDLVGDYGAVLVTPNTLTETSNLLGQHGEPERSRFFATFRSLIDIHKEIVVASIEAARNAAFSRLGLTDAALLEVVSAETPLVTVDMALYLAALSKAPDAAVSFTHRQRL